MKNEYLIIEQDGLIRRIFVGKKKKAKTTKLLVISFLDVLTMGIDWSGDASSTVCSFTETICRSVATCASQCPM